MTPEMFERVVKNNVVRKFATLKELADFYGIDWNNLKAENDKFNGYMRNKKGSGI